MQTTGLPDLRALRLNGLKVKTMNVKSYFTPFRERGHRAAMGWKVKTTATCQSLLRDPYEIILRVSFQTRGALWA